MILDELRRRPIMAAGLSLGIGMGGFVDGILFHQILQTHGMLTAIYPKTGFDEGTDLLNSEINMFWDGLFHAFTWTMTALGVLLLWRAARTREVALSNSLFGGSLLLGAGLFNLVEGLIDHEILAVHHVVEGGDPLLGDMIFLGSGFALIVLGWLTIRGEQKTVADARRLPDDGSVDVGEQFE